MVNTRAKICLGEIPCKKDWCNLILSVITLKVSFRLPLFLNKLTPRETRFSEPVLIIRVKLWLKEILFIALQLLVWTAIPLEKLFQWHKTKLLWSISIEVMIILKLTNKPQQALVIYLINKIHILIQKGTFRYLKQIIMI